MKSSIYVDSVILDKITAVLVSGFYDKALDLSLVYEDCLLLGSYMLMSARSKNIEWFETTLSEARRCIDSYPDLSSGCVDFDSDDIPFMNQGSDF